MNTPLRPQARSIGSRQPQCDPSGSNETARIRNLCDLFHHDLAQLDVCVHAVRYGILQLARIPSCARLRPLFDEIDAIARTHLFPIDQALARHNVGPTEIRSPAIHGILEETRSYIDHAAHPSVGDAGVLGALRRLTRYMEGLCMATAESATLLGLDDIRRDLNAWAAAWRGLERHLQRAASESNAVAFLVP